MGKGSGKLNLWFLRIQAGTVLTEFKHLRPGRAMYFINQLKAKLAVNATPLWRNTLSVKYKSLAKVHIASEQLFKRT